MFTELPSLVSLGLEIRVVNLLLACWRARLSCAGGKRLLRQWLCRPLRSMPAINDRLDAVEEIASRPGLIAPFRRLLKTMPDLERALGRARNSNAPPAEGLPDWAVKAAQNRCRVFLPDDHA